MRRYHRSAEEVFSLLGSFALDGSIAMFKARECLQKPIRVDSRGNVRINHVGYSKRSAIALSFLFAGACGLRAQDTSIESVPASSNLGGFVEAPILQVAVDDSKTDLGQSLLTENAAPPALIRLQPLDAEGVYSPVVTALAASEDGKWLVASGDDHAIRVVERSTGLMYQLLEGHLDWVQSVAFIDNGESVLSCGIDGTLRLWSLKTEGKASSQQPKSRILHQSSTALWCLAISPDQKHVAIGGFGESIWIYNLTTGELIRELVCECGDQRCLAFSRDGKQLACGGRDGVLRVWDWVEAGENEKHPYEQKLHHGRIRSVSFSEDNKTVTTIAEDRRLVRYRIDNGQVLLDQKILGGKLMAMTQLSASLFAIAGADNTIRIIESSDGREVHRLVGHDGSVVVLVKNGKELISSSYDTTIRYWDIEKATQQDSTPYEHPVSARYIDSGVSENIR